MSSCRYLSHDSVIEWNVGGARFFVVRFSLSFADMTIGVELEGGLLVGLKLGECTNFWSASPIK